MIEIEALTKSYGKLTAVDQLNLSVGKGELFGFLGPNGAGKTTTIQILATLLAPTSGSVRVAGFDVTREGRQARRKIGYMPDEFGLYDNLSVREYLEFFGAAYGLNRKERQRLCGEVLELVDLAGKTDERVGALSRGMHQRLGLARVLVHDPEVLLLDEPASGLDPRSRIEMREILKELRDMGKTLLISSHILPELAGVCTSLAIIQSGRLVAHGSVNDLLGQAGAGSIVRARVEGDLQQLNGRLESIADVRKIALEEDAVAVHFATLAPDAGAVAEAIIASGLRLVELGTERSNLEDAYMRLTETESA